MRKLKKVCNLDCFNCIFEDCILPDYYVSSKKLMDLQNGGSCVQEKSVKEVPKKEKASLKKTENYYQRNRNKFKEYYQKNKDKILEYQKEYYQENKDRLRERRYKYYEIKKREA